MTDVDVTFTPDANAFQNSLQDVATANQVLLTYVADVGAINTDPQPFSSGGMNASADPYATMPDFKTVVLTAKTHGQTFVMSVYFALDNWAGSVATFSTTFSQDVESIMNVVAAAGTKPTAGQRQQVMTSFTDISTNLTNLQSGLSTIHASLVQFVDWMITDHAALTTGSADVSTAITTVQTWFTNEALQYVGQVGGNAIIGILGTLQTGVIAALTTLKSQLTTATQASSDASSGASALLNLLGDLTAKCSSVITFVTNASDASFGTAIERIELRAAVSAWSQLAQFAANTI